MDKFLENNKDLQDSFCTIVIIFLSSFNQIEDKFFIECLHYLNKVLLDQIKLSSNFSYSILTKIFIMGMNKFNKEIFEVCLRLTNEIFLKNENLELKNN